jgi:hypothetical protein
MSQPFTREQRTTIVYAILCLVLLTVVLQLWLLAATTNAYLGGEDAVIVPAAAASLLCFGVNLFLLRALYRLERRRTGRPSTRNTGAARSLSRGK